MAVLVLAQSGVLKKREFLDVTLPAKIRRYDSTKGITMAA
jgi:hypothetical protein